jgi:5,10-methylenetetrahydromethanopterin reductase
MNGMIPAQSSLDRQLRVTAASGSQVRVSGAFPTTMSSPEDIRVAEETGYDWAWLYDTPQ